ncbi:Uncharacterised protein [Mycobacteroides abscessus subsp. abscessus]|nr:Uncharacterised protein [Mycobacteroides abscessus subsp. abscessus]
MRHDRLVGLGSMVMCKSSSARTSRVMNSVSQSFASSVIEPCPAA